MSSLRYVFERKTHVLAKTITEYARVMVIVKTDVMQ